MSGKAQYLDASGVGRVKTHIFDYVDKSIKDVEAKIPSIPESLPAVGGDADTVGGFTVGCNVPADAKFTDTVYTHPKSGVTAGTYKSVTVNEYGHVTGGTNPTTLSGYGITDAATKTQGSKADTAVQTVKIGSVSYTGTTVSLPAYPTTLPASDVSSWAKASSKPSYTYSEVGADKSGSANQALEDAKEYTNQEIKKIYDISDDGTINSILELKEAMEENADAIDALNQIAGNKANSSDLTSHTSNTNIHITSDERTKWNAAKTHADSAHAPSGAEVNQNAFSKIKVDSTTVSSTGKTDTFNIIAGSNITLTPSTSGKSVTISATDTKFVHPSHTAAASGLYKVAVDSLGHVISTTAVTKSDITALGIPGSDTQYAHPTYTARTGVPAENQTPGFGGTFNVSQPISDATGHITAINSRTVTIPSTAASQSAAGLMSAADKKKLDGIATGANNYTYTLPDASSSTKGGVKIGSNITVSSGTISLTKANVTDALGYTPPTTNTTYVDASQSASGLMSASDKKKLDGITSSADSVSFTQSLTTGTQVGTITINGTQTKLYAPTNTDTTYSAMTGATSSAAGTSGLVPAPAAGKQGSFLRGDGTWVVPTDTKYSAMKGATSSAAGSSGLVPTPAAGKETAFLRGDGTWVVPTDTKYTLPDASSSTKGGVKIGSNITVSSGTISLTKANVTSALGYTPPTTNTTYVDASQSASGLMSAADKKKLDGIASGANNYTYTLPTASSTLGGVKTTSTVTSTSGLTAAPIISGVVYYKDTKYTLPDASSSTKGGVKIGSNITVSSGTISLTKANVTSALGYTPPTTDTKYTLPAASANALGGIMVAKVSALPSSPNANTLYIVG